MSRGSTTEPVETRRALFGVLAVCAAAALLYASTIDDYFVRDDFGVVQLLAGKPAASFPRWFYSSWMDEIWGFVPDEIRPFPAVSYQLTALPGAAVPWGHHLFNVGFHALNGVLVLATARVVAGLSLPAAALAGVAFAVLPVNAESAAWITGRVDSMPAFFYVAAFLLYVRWRDTGKGVTYAIAVLVYFIALFTKQNTITFPATLMAYDLLLAPRRFGSTARAAGAYAPFMLLTAAYLILRYALFGEVAREDRLTAQALTLFVQLAARHLAHVIAGGPDAPPMAVLAIAAGVLALVVASRDSRARAVRLAVFFAPVWWIIGIAPILVAGYESPRHVYLAAMGWAVLLGMAADRAARGGMARRYAVAIVATAVLAAYAAILAGVVREWNRIASVSERAVRRLERESRTSPPGALIIVGVPPVSWEWAMPFAVQPPFANADLTERSIFVYPNLLHCCRTQWASHMRRALRRWAGGPAADTVIVLRVDDETGPFWRVTATENPALPVLARQLLEIGDSDRLDEAVRRLVDELPVQSR